MAEEQGEGGAPWGIFAVGVVGMTVTTFMVLLVVVGVMEWGKALVVTSFSAPSPELEFRWGVFLLTVGIVCVMVTLSFFSRLTSLDGRGDSLVNEWGGENLGADQDQVLKAVHRLSQDAQMKTPTVYLLSHQPGINAFATGDHHDRAVIAVTAGALRELPLPEVTALLAHQVGFIATGDAAAGFRALPFIAGLRSIWSLGSRSFYRAFVEPSDTALRAAIVAAGKDGGSYEHLSSQARGEAKQGEKGGNHVAFSLATQGRATNQKLAQRKIRLTPGLVFFLPFAAIICFAGLPGYLAALVIQSSLGRVGSYRGDHCAEELLGEREELMRVLGRIAAHPCGSKIFGRRGCEIAHIVFADYASKNLRTLVATHLPLPERLQALLGDRLTGEEGEHRA